MAESLPLSIENLRIHDELTEEVEFRQFACEPCYRSWWKRVRAKKPVSHCRNCKTKYDTLPRDQEFGVAEFVCPKCGHTFTGRGKVTTTCRCYDCQTRCKVSRIVPGQRGITRKTELRHSCDECTEDGCPNFKPVIYFSRLHDSTGSTTSSVTEREFEVKLPPKSSQY